MARIYDNGIYRDMTPDEEAAITDPAVNTEPAADPLYEMVTAMSTATTLAQMRAAAKNFLERTEVG